MYTIKLTNEIENDAEIVNRLGIIRGSIQRVVKLETNQIASNGIISVVDETFEVFLSRSTREYSINRKVEECLEELKEAWIQLKGAIEGFRQNPNDVNRNRIIEKSELMWEKSNNTVFNSQIMTESKVENYRKSFIVFFANLILVLVIIFLVKRYVKDNLEYTINHDNLTKCYNRRYYSDYLKNQIFISRRYGHKLSLIMFDIDHFKRVNDTYGHDIGDIILKELVTIGQATIRNSDVLARIGGEEFAIIAPNTSLQEGFNLSERFRKTVENNSFTKVGHLTISLGVTQFVDKDDINSLHKKADIALYRAKNNGRNRTEVEYED